MLCKTIANDYGPRGSPRERGLPGLGPDAHGRRVMDGLAVRRGTDARGRVRARTHAHVPLRRPAEPEEIASVVAFLLSPRPPT